MIEIQLTCETCGDRKTVRAFNQKSKMGVLRVMAGTGGWAVDGSGARCGAHRKPTDERETWEEYDRWSVEQRQAHEREREEALRMAGF